MYPPFPAESARAFYDAFAAVNASAVDVFAHRHVRVLRFDARFQRAQAGEHLGGDRVVGVQPHEVVARRLLEGKVAGGGKIVRPRERKDGARVPLRKRSGIVRAARVHNHDLVHGVLYAVQTARQHFLFVPNDHTKR